MERCAECERLRSACAKAAERLVETQQDLARYRSPAATAEFKRLWRNCEEALQMSTALRQEMAQHLGSH